MARQAKERKQRELQKKKDEDAISEEGNELNEHGQSDKKMKDSHNVNVNDDHDAKQKDIKSSEKHVRVSEKHHGFLVEKHGRHSTAEKADGTAGARASKHTEGGHQSPRSSRASPQDHYEPQSRRRTQKVGISSREVQKEKNAKGNMSGNSKPKWNPSSRAFPTTQSESRSASESASPAKGHRKNNSQTKYRTASRSRNKKSSPTRNYSTRSRDFNSRGGSLNTSHSHNGVQKRSKSGELKNNDLIERHKRQHLSDTEDQSEFHSTVELIRTADADLRASSSILLEKESAVRGSGEEFDEKQKSKPGKASNIRESQKQRKERERQEKISEAEEVCYLGQKLGKAQDGDSGERKDSKEASGEDSDNSVGDWQDLESSDQAAERVGEITDEVSLNQLILEGKVGGRNKVEENKEESEYKPPSSSTKNVSMKELARQLQSSNTEVNHGNDPNSLITPVTTTSHQPLLSGNSTFTPLPMFRRTSPTSNGNFNSSKPPPVPGSISSSKPSSSLQNSNLKVGSISNVSSNMKSSVKSSAEKHDNSNPIGSIVMNGLAGTSLTTSDKFDNANANIANINHVNIMISDSPVRHPPKEFPNVQGPQGGSPTATNFSATNFCDTPDKNVYKRTGDNAHGDANTQPPLNQQLRESFRRYKAQSRSSSANPGQRGWSGLPDRYNLSADRNYDQNSTASSDSPRHDPRPQSTLNSSRLERLLNASQNNLNRSMNASQNNPPNNPRQSRSSFVARADNLINSVSEMFEKDRKSQQAKESERQKRMRELHEREEKRREMERREMEAERQEVAKERQAIQQALTDRAIQLAKQEKEKDEREKEAERKLKEKMRMKEKKLAEKMEQKIAEQIAEQIADKMKVKEQEMMEEQEKILQEKMKMEQEKMRILEEAQRSAEVASEKAAEAAVRAEEAVGQGKVGTSSEGVEVPEGSPLDPEEQMILERGRQAAREVASNPMYHRGITLSGSSAVEFSDFLAAKNAAKGGKLIQNAINVSPSQQLQAEHTNFLAGTGSQFTRKKTLETGRDLAEREKGKEIRDQQKRNSAIDSARDSATDSVGRARKKVSNRSSQVARGLQALAARRNRIVQSLGERGNSRNQQPGDQLDHAAESETDENEIEKSYVENSLQSLVERSLTVERRRNRGDGSATDQNVVSIEMGSSRYSSPRSPGSGERSMSHISNYEGRHNTSVTMSRRSHSAPMGQGRQAPPAAFAPPHVSPPYEIHVTPPGDQNQHITHNHKKNSGNTHKNSSAKSSSNSTTYEKITAHIKNSSGDSGKQLNRTLEIFPLSSVAIATRPTAPMRANTNYDGRNAPTQVTQRERLADSDSIDTPTSVPPLGSLLAGTGIGSETPDEFTSEFLPSASDGPLSAIDKSPQTLKRPRRSALRQGM